MATLIKILDNAKFLSKTVLGEVSPIPTYQLGSNVASVDEGSSVTFTLSTTNISNGTLVPYVITGVSLADLASGVLTGNFTVVNGSASASVTLAADALTEGAETMTVSLSSGVASASVVVNDTSRTPTYAIGRSLSAVDEGSSVTFTLSTTNVANGTVLPYTISGISSTDVTTGSLTGSFTVSNNLATATITMSADQLTEGAETATLTLNNAAASNFVVVNDTSVFTPATISGLQLWLDAADASTLFDATAGGNLVTTDGAAVARWQDKSGNNRHATQGTANARPLLKTGIKNARNGLRFDGVNDIIQTPSYSLTSNAFTIYAVVARPWQTTKFAAVISQNYNQTTGLALITTQLTVQDWLVRSIASFGNGYNPGRSPRANGQYSTSIANNTFHILGTSMSSSQATLTLDGSSVATNQSLAASVPSNTGAFQIGNNSLNDQWNGDICEILFYDAALTTTQRQAVESYLNSKWAIY